MPQDLKSGGLKRRLLRGFGASALGPVVTAAIQLGTVPLLLHAWGAAKYGDWLILFAVPSYLSLCDLGFGDASGSDMTVRVGAGDREGALRTFQSSWVFLLFISAAVLAIALATVWWVPWQPQLHLSSLSSREASYVILALAAYVVATQQNGVFESGFRCDGNFALGTLFIILLRFFEAATALLVGIISGNLLYVALGYLVLRIAGTVAYAMLLRRKSPWLSLGFRHADWKTVKKLAAPALGFVAFPLGYAISLQGFTLLIGGLLGPIAVTMFGTLRTLTRMNFQLLNVIGWTVWPELSRAFGAGKIELARSLHRHAYQVGLLLSLVSGAALWVIGPYVYALWTRHQVVFDAQCFHILILVTFANSLWYTSSVVPMSTNAHHRLAFSFVGISAASLLLARLLAPLAGMRGAAWALLLVDVCMIWLVLRTALTQLGDTAGGFLAGVFKLPEWRSATPEASEA